MRIVRGEYHNPKHEYEVHVPDGIAEILGDCSGGIGNGFQVSLAHPEGGDGDWALNQIEVSAMDRRETLQQIIDAWHRVVKEESESNFDSDHQFNEPEQTSLSSLPALGFKWLARTEPERIIAERIIAKNPDKDIVYSITMITPVDQYEKNKKLFRQIVDGFRCVSTPE